MHKKSDLRKSTKIEAAL